MKRKRENLLSGKVRPWVFTINNPTSAPVFGPEVQYYVYQKEVGSRSSLSGQGTPHYQGYVVFKEPMHFQTVRKLLPNAHLEKARGTAQQNWTYCTKDRTRVEGPWFSSGEDGDFRKIPEQESFRGPPMAKLLTARYCAMDENGRLFH